MPGDQDNPNAPAPDAAAAPAAGTGKVRVEEMTLARFSEDQLSALKQGNLERTTRGLPPWVISDYVRVHRGRFREVDYELDDAEAKERADAAPAPNAATRVDQRPAG